MGTFTGVFTPSILTILGLILFLRLGYVVGSAGLGRALLIICLANAISILTSISLSAIATNINIKGGGDYYLISRTLGLEFGGAIGIVLFLAQSVSIGFYCIGFGDILAALLPIDLPHLSQGIAALAVALLFFFAWLGSDWATRFQFVVMAILVSALVSFVLGAVPSWDPALLTDSWHRPAGGLPFWTLFAIFFPAVTGFTQGVSMSGELKDQGKSLPMGTFLAVLLSACIYILFAFLFAAALPKDVLIQDYEAMNRVSRYGFLIDAGVIAATLSSAMASFLGGPRILQSLARDRIFPFLRPFALGSGPASNPRRGVLLSAAIAMLTVGLGNLNLIATVVSMFFLISYGLLNYATFFEARAASPSFRPRFRFFHGHLSLLGGMACLGVMLAISPAAGAVAIAVLFSVHQYLRRTAGPARWSDSRRSYHLHQARENLLAADREPEHPRDWRPQLLVLTESPQKREPLLRFASWLTVSSGLTTVTRILEGQGAALLSNRELIEEELRKDLQRFHPKAFPLVLMVPDAEAGIYALAQAVGTGPLKINTILFDWFDYLPGLKKSVQQEHYAQNLRTVYHLGANIVSLVTREDSWNNLKNMHVKKRRIDVWWLGDETSRFMLLMAYLMTRSDAWAQGRIRVLAAESSGSYEEALDFLGKTLRDVRIPAEPEVVEGADAEAIVEQSENAALVFLPFRFRNNQLTGPFGAPVETLINRLPTTALCLAARDIELDAEPEGGKAGEIADALKALEGAEKESAEAEKEAARETAAADEQFRGLYADALAGRGEDEIAEQEVTALETRHRANQAILHAARCRENLEIARAALEALGVEAPGKKKPGLMDKNGKDNA